MLYLSLIGMISERSSSFGACREIASATSIWSPNMSRAGTTPEVERVTRRLEMLKPKSSIISFMAGTTLARLSSGSPMPIITTLVMGRLPPTTLAARHT
ncbi:hypothetical protein D3C86_1745770 [compost metagenome]